MSLKCRVLKSGQCEITQSFVNGHRGLDLVGKDYTIDDVVAYDDGVVQLVTNGCGNGQGEGVNWAYGNFVKLLHDNGTVTLYAHMVYTSVSYGQRVSKGQKLGRMGNSGNSFGAHLHWEYWSRDDYYANIDPAPYLNPKEIKIPIPVNRDKNKRQFQVDYNDSLRIRKNPNGDILGILNAGIYDFTEEKLEGDYNWVNIGCGWCACTNMSRILEIEKEKPFTNVIERQEEENKENNINTSVDIETSVEMPKNSKIDNTDIILINQDKKNPLVELIKYLIKLLKSIFNKG